MYWNDMRNHKISHVTPAQTTVILVLFEFHFISVSKAILVHYRLQFLVATDKGHLFEVFMTKKEAAERDGDRSDPSRRRGRYSNPRPPLIAP